VARRAAAVLLAAAGLLLGGGPAAAQEDPGGGRAGRTLRSAAYGVGYAVPAVGAILTTAVNGVHLAYDEGTPRGWRIAGYVFGGVEIALGATLLVVRGEGTENTVLAIVPIGLGVAALATAFFAPEPDDVVGGAGWARVAPFVTPDGGGLSVIGRF
jgi:hypothetical protein